MTQGDLELPLDFLLEGNKELQAAFAIQVLAAELLIYATSSASFQETEKRC